MQVTVQEAGPGTVELLVHVEPEQYSKAREQVVDLFVAQAQIPGFRKGKAPRTIVERSISHDVLRSRAVEKVLPEAYKQALAESGLDPLTDPEVELLPGDDQQELRFKMVVHKRPEITPGPYRGLELTKYVTRIADTDVDDAVQQLREEAAKYESMEDTAAEKGDALEYSLDVLRDGEPIENAHVDEMVTRIGEYAQAPAVDDDLIGMKAGETREIEVVYPDDYTAEEVRGQTCVWRVMAKEVKRKHLPELTDEFVEQQWDFEDVEAMRARVRADLEKRAEELDSSAVRTAALNSVVDSSSVVFPRILLEQEVDGRLERLERTLRRNRHTIVDFAAAQGVTPETVYAQIAAQAELDLTEYLLLHRIAADEGIVITPEEVDAHIEAEGVRRGARSAIIELEKKTDSRRSAASYEVLKERVLDLILENAEIKTETQSLARAEEQAEEVEDTGEEI